MRSPTCPRLARDLTDTLRIWPHLTDEALTRKVADHVRWCGCDGSGWTPTRGLARDPRDDPKEETR